MLYEHFRNYGCRLHMDYFYKNLRVAVLENEYLRVSVLIDKGTDIFEFLYKPKDMDFMWLSPWGINSPANFVPSVSAREGNFMDYYEGGWQEILPNFGYGGKYYGTIEEGLHGEVCLVPWDHQVVDNNRSTVAIKFSVRTYRTPFYLEKTLTLKKGDPKLYISERLKNEGYSDISFMWTHHPVYGGAFLDNSVLIDVPENEVKLVMKNDGGTFYFESDNPENTWPVFKGSSGSITDFSKSSALVKDNETGMDEVGIRVKKDGWYAVTNLKKKVGIGFKWDSRIFPYLWIWRTYGNACKAAPWFGRAECMAIELCSSCSSEGLEGAINNKTALSLEPQKEILTDFFAIAYESDSRVKGIDKDGIINP